MEENAQDAPAPTTTGYQCEDRLFTVPDLVSFDDLIERVWPGVTTPEITRSGFFSEN